jgi:hypothetical protein
MNEGFERVRGPWHRLSRRWRDSLKLLKMLLPSVFGFVLVALILLAVGGAEAGKALLHLVRAHLWTLARHANH